MNVKDTYAKAVIMSGQDMMMVMCMCMRSREPGVSPLS